MPEEHSIGDCSVLSGMHFMHTASLLLCCPKKEMSMTIKIFENLCKAAFKDWWWLIIYISLNACFKLSVLFIYMPGKVSNPIFVYFCPLLSVEVSYLEQCRVFVCQKN